MDIGSAEPDIGLSSAAQRFEQLAQRAMSAHYRTRLSARRLGEVPKTFDFVSEDGGIVGDAKFFTLVGGARLPPAKFSVIAEHVWLLDKTRAPQTFLVFGNDCRVPEEWLKRYGKLRGQVEFYFLREAGELECLTRAMPMKSDGVPKVTNQANEREFHEQMVIIYHAALRECNYKALRFLQTV